MGINLKKILREHELDSWEVFLLEIFAAAKRPLFYSDLLELGEARIKREKIRLELPAFKPLLLQSLQALAHRKKILKKQDVMGKGYAYSL